MMFRALLLLWLVWNCLAGVSTAQSHGWEGEPFRERLLQRFDRDGDGRLSGAERESLRDFVRRRKALRGASGPMEEPEPDKLSGLYGQSTPRRAITSQDLTLVDSDRDKTLEFRATFPSGSTGRLPVIVWSHGMYGSQDFYGPLVRHWAGHGYLVLQPTHSDSLRRGEGLAVPTSDWASRPADVSFLLDSLPEHPLLQRKADLSRVGVGGHSYGAHTSMLLNGARPRFGRRTLVDSRPRAFVAISPQGESRLLDGSSWLGLKRPTLFISGDLDKSRHGDGPEWRLAPYKGAPAGHKYLLWIRDAHHNFGGISGAWHTKSGPANGDQVALVKSATLGFWDAYLKGDPVARQWLGSGRFQSASQGMAQWSQR